MSVAASKPSLALHVRWMIRRDMPEVVAIEEDSFERPWRPDDFAGTLRERNNIGIVCECCDRVVGFCLYGLRPKRIEVLNFAVAADMRRLGVGSALIANIAKKLSPQRRSRIVADVRETNLLAQLFFRAVGFRAEDVLRGRFSDCVEDAYRFALRVRGAA